MDTTKLWTQTYQAMNLHLSLNFLSDSLKEMKNQTLMSSASASAASAFHGKQYTLPKQKRFFESHCPTAPCAIQTCTHLSVHDVISCINPSLQDAASWCSLPALTQPFRQVWGGLYIRERKIAPGTEECMKSVSCR